MSRRLVNAGPEMLLDSHDICSALQPTSVGSGNGRIRSDNVPKSVVEMVRSSAAGYASAKTTGRIPANSGIYECKLRFEHGQDLSISRVSFPLKSSVGSRKTAWSQGLA